MTDEDDERGAREATAPAGARATPLAPPPRLIVGVGASAGGLESLGRLFAHVPEDAGLAFVVVQHLSPDHETMMVELIARHTTLDVRAASHGARLRRDTVHVLSPGERVTLSEGRLLLESLPRDEPSLPIDHFFESLAGDAGARAVAIVLSGTGADGARGIGDVKALGGLVLAETTLTARFDGMPASAVATGHVDHVLAPEEMGELLAAHARARESGATNPTAAGEDPDLEVERVLELLHARHGIDFGHYKSSSVRRRIARRVALADAESRADYVERLRDDARELDALFHDLLIGVTRFFRDEACFQRLELEVLPRLLGRLGNGEPFRAWVAGCATGEEAYSIAMLVHEAIAASGREIEAKIFATDLHRDALARAASGVYPAERLDDVPAERRARHFEPHEGGFRVAEHLRRLLLFAPHDLLNDAPFTRLSLVSCRNLLIYFDVPAQQRTLRLLHHALDAGGALMLGPSETLGPLADAFTVLDERCRLFRKESGSRLSGLPPPTLPRALPSEGVAGVVPARGAERVDPRVLETYDALLERFMPPSVLIDAGDAIVDSFGGAARFLHYPSRRPSADLFSALDTPSSGELRAAVLRARGGRALELANLALREASGAESVHDVTLEPVGGRGGARSGYVLLRFRARADDPAAAAAAAGEGAGTPRERHDASPLTTGVDPEADARTLREELSATRLRLQRSIELADTTHEELQATNEELVAANEELQSSNEELHAANEELHTVNAEYQNKITELRELNADMDHLLASTEIGTLFLDRELRVRRFTPRVRRAYDLAPSDVGRPIAAFSHRLDIDDLDAVYAEVLGSGAPFEREVRDRDGGALLLRVTPYRIVDQVAGVVMTLVDIRTLDEARAALADSEAALARRLAELQSLYETTPAGLTLIDRDMRYVRANERMAEIDGVPLEAYEDASIDDVLPAPLAARVRRIFEGILESGRPFLNQRVRTSTRAHPDEERDYVVNYYPVHDGDGAIIAISCVIVELPTRRRARAAEGDDASGGPGDGAVPEPAR